jgi:hypothetical protein
LKTLRISNFFENEIFCFGGGRDLFPVLTLSTSKCPDQGNITRGSSLSPAAIEQAQLSRGQCTVIEGFQVIAHWSTERALAAGLIVEPDCKHSWHRETDNLCAMERCDRKQVSDSDSLPSEDEGAGVAVVQVLAMKKKRLRVGIRKKCC